MIGASFIGAAPLAMTPSAPPTLDTRRLARVGDATSHGGYVTGGAPHARCNGAAVARVDDTVSCPAHGPQQIATGSSTVTCEGKAAAHAGSLTTCGAYIVDGSANTQCG